MITTDALAQIYEQVAPIRDVVLLRDPDRIRPCALETRFPHPDTGRLLTEAELPISHGLPVVLDIGKGRIQNSPGVWPRGKGWIVWLIETYPGHYLARSPGDAPVPVQYNEIYWEPVPDDTPVTTVAELKTKEKERCWYWNGWRVNHSKTTPGTRLKWQNLSGWLDCWQKVKSRADGRAYYWHLKALPPAMIDLETEPQRLYMLAAELNRLPAWHTLAQSLVDVADKRLAHLRCPTSRQYWLQQLSNAEPTYREEMPPTLF